MSKLIQIVNDNTPIFTSPTTKRIAENTAAGTTLFTVTATDADTDAVLTYKISGGADRALFALDSNTQVLSFIGPAPDFEAERSNKYVVDVEVSDGKYTETQRIKITVTDVNDNAPIFTSPTTKNIAENTAAGTTLLTVTATDADTDAVLNYRISGGADSALFNLDSDTQVLSFIGPAPDFEAERSNDYVVDVEVSDGKYTETQSITIAVTDVARSIDKGKYLSLDGRNDYMQVADHDDLDIDPGKSFTFTLWTRSEPPSSGSYDFILDKRERKAGTGYEIFSDSDGKYVLGLEAPVNRSFGTAYNRSAALDGDWHHIAFVVDRSAKTSSIYIDGKLLRSKQRDAIETADFSNATDLLIGGGRGRYLEGDIDEIRIFSKAMTAAELRVDMETSLTGSEKSLLAAWNFENVNGNSVTDISGNGHNATLVNGATINNANHNAPIFTSPTTKNIAENTVAGTTLLTVKATDADAGAVLTYKISGGADRALFNLDSDTQVLSFIGPAPDFEAERSNDYVVDVEVSDGKYTETQSITIAVTDVNDNMPIFTSPTTKNIAENTAAGTTLLTVTATDADTDAVLNYRISGGADSTLFNLDSNTQVLSFIGPAPDFEAERSNKYVVDVEVSDGKYTETQSITIAVTDVNDNMPIFTSPTTKNIAENTAAGTTLLTVTATDADTDAVLNYRISGGADSALFNLDSDTQVLSFIGPAPDFEAERSNKYVVDVEVSDGKYTETQSIKIAVTDVNDNAPIFTSPTTKNIAENTVAGTTLLTVKATDADAGAVLTYKISGGADSALFNLDSDTQVLSFIGPAPDFEAERSNKYVVDVEVSDGAHTETQRIKITVTDVNDNAPIFTSPTTKRIAENTVAGTTLLTVTATDADTDAVLTYKISGGADRALFALDSNTQVLSFIGPAPDFEAERSNKYVVDVEVSDGAHTETQRIKITVTDVNDNAPIFTSPTTKRIAENTVAGTTLLTVTATDADTDAVLTYKISGGADRALFALDSNTQVLSFIGPAPDFEAERSNDYVVKVRVSDGAHTETQSIKITVTDVNDNMPIFTSPTTKNIAENTAAGTTLLTVKATDADAGAVLTYKISGGADRALFALDSNTQVLSFIGPAPDLGRSNEYVVDVEVSDGKYTETQSITITVVDTAPNGKYLRLDGIDDHMQVLDHDDLDIDPGKSFTLALWIRAEPPASYDFILDKREGKAGTGYETFANSAGKYGLNLVTPTNRNFGTDYSRSVALDGDWHHIAFVVDRSTKTSSIYIDGKPVGSSSIGTADFSNATDLLIGGGRGRYLEGDIDEIRIFSKAMTAAELRVDMETGLTGNEADLLAAWDFENVSRGSVTDISGNGHNGRLVNGATIVDSTIVDTAPNGKYLRLDGIDDHMQVLDHADLDIDPGKSFTLALWIRAESPASYDFILDKREGSNGTGYEIGFNSEGKYLVNLEAPPNRNFGTAFSRSVALDGDWHHIAFVVDRSTKTVTIYIDGKPVGSRSIETADFSNASDLFIGTGRGAYFMEGDIDEIRIFSKAMTAAELRVDMETSLTGNEKSLLAAWDFEDVDGNSVTDISGNGHNGRLVNGATIVNYKPAAMIFSSVELAPQITTSVARGNKDERVILVNVRTAGELSALDINELQITLAGTEPANIDTINVYYTGRSSALDTTTLFGTASPSTGIITINGSQTLRGGNNYFWVTYNISDSATEGEFIDATVESVTVDGSPETPVFNEATGSRLILLEHNSLWRAGDDGAQWYRIPALTTALDGSLIAVVDKRYVKGLDIADNVDIDIVAKRSTDGGKTWSEAVTLADFGAREGASDPLIITDKITGDILVLYLAYNGVRYSEPSNRARTYVSRSKDNGATWLAPVEITNDIYPDGWHLVWATSGSFSQTRDGRMMAVVAARQEAGGFATLTNHLIYSDDGGYTWDIYTGSPNTRLGYGDESKVIELDNGHLYMNLRDQKKAGNYRRISYSDDGGQSWTESAQELELPDPRHNADLIRYTSVHDGFDKSRILFSNARHPNDWKNLHVYMSEDEATTWTYKKQIDAGPSNYSSLTVLPNGDIGILYEKGVKVEEIVFTRVSLDWLTGGKDKYTPLKEAEYRASVLTGDQGFIIQGDVARYQKVTDYTDEADDSIGLSVSRAGDVNGDGIDDLIVGAPGSDEYIGAAYVIFGKDNNGFGTAVDNGAGTNRQLIDLSSLTAAQGFIIQGDVADDQAGYSVSSAGDVNGDGYDDLIIGAYQGDDGGVDAGEAYVVFGKKNGFGTEVETSGNKRQVIDLTSLTAADGFIIQGDAADDQAGYSVSSAGDVNGDGYDDLIVGAPHDDAGGVSAGAAYVVFGKAAGFGTAVDNGAGTNRQVIDLTSLTAADGFIIQGDTADDQAGYSVSSAGDVNGDGYDDLIVGAYQGNDGGVDAGETYVVFGKKNGFGTAVDNAGTNRQVIDLTSLTAAQGFIIQGDAAMDKAGLSVSSTGDVNGDGYDDLIIGAYQGDDGGIDAGEAYVVFGKAAGFGTEVDTSGNKRQVIDVASLTADQGFIIQGGTHFDKAGYSVSSAGDVNGDGFDDLIIGAHFGNGNGIDVGTAYVVFGKAAGFGTAVDNGAGTNRQVIDLSSLTAVDGFVIQSNTRNKATAVSVSAVGDVNDDGFDDLIVGAYQGGDAGEAYVIFGKAMPGGTASVNTTGDTSAETLIGGAGNDNLTGGGGADVLRGGAGDDVLGVADTTFRRIDGGTGNDMLRIDGSGITLDFTNLLPNKVSGVELIDLTGSGANALELDIRDLLDISDDTQDGTTILRVLGDADDAVRTADSGWIKGDNVNIGGQYFHQFDNVNARLLVDTNVDISSVLG